MWATRYESRPTGPSRGAPRTTSMPRWTPTVPSPPGTSAPRPSPQQPTPAAPSCTVEVQPRYDTFEEPLYNYLSLHPLSVLKEAETREILEQNDKEIVYKGVAPLEKISYSIVWQDEMPFVLNAVAYISSVAYLDECIAFMDERYERRDEGEQGEDAIWAFYYNNAELPIGLLLLIPILRLLICGLSILLSQRTYPTFNK